MRRYVRSIIPLALAGSALVASSASAAALITPKCVRYVPGFGAAKYVPIAGSGFTPGGSLRLGYGTSHLADLAGYPDANAAGAFFGRFLGPTSIIGTKKHFISFPLTAYDYNTSALVTGTHINFVRVDVTYGIKHPKRVTRYTVYGFPNGKPVWAHFWFAGRERAVVRIGRTHGPCGVASRRFRALPARFRTGTWHVFFNGSRRLTRLGVRHKRYYFNSSFITYIRFVPRYASAAAARQL